MSENVENKATNATFYTKKDILRIFEGKGQVEIPTRDQIVKAKKAKKEPKIPKVVTPKQPRKPSRTYLSNLNTRILKADRLWSKLLAHEKGELLMSVGITNDEDLVYLANSKKTPDVVIDWFINNKNQPKSFHRRANPIGPREVVKPFQSFDEHVKTIEYLRSKNPTRALVLTGSIGDVRR